MGYINEMPDTDDEGMLSLHDYIVDATRENSESTIDKCGNRLEDIKIKQFVF